MKTNLIGLLLLVILFGTAQAQTEPTLYIGRDEAKNAHPKAILEIESSDQGILVPRIPKKQKEAMFKSAPDPSATGMLIFQTDEEQGFYYYDGRQWIRMGGKIWFMGGNEITDPDNISGGGRSGSPFSQNSIGTTNNHSLWIKVNNKDVFQFQPNGTLDFMTTNLIIQSNVSDVNASTIFGTYLPENIGKNNAFFGINAGKNNTKGEKNTIVGYGANSFNKTGSYNTSLGYLSNAKNTGSNNTIIGAGAGLYNENGSDNVFIGNEAGANTRGSDSLIISNSADKALIQGNFKKNILRVGGNLLVDGNLGKINGVKYQFPDKQGEPNTYLQNIGNGFLTWSNPSQNGAFWALGGNFVSANQDYFIGTKNAYDLIFKVNKEERMRLDREGRLSLGQNGNIAIGDSSAYYLNFANSLVEKYPSTYFGKSAGKNAKNATNNIGIGFQALAENIEGGANVALGNNAGQFNTVSTGNVLIGNQTGMRSYGNYNIMIGKEAGQNNRGSNNIIIGSQAGMTETNLNDAFILANNKETSLLRGSFVKGKEFLSINGIVVIGNSEATPTNGAIRYQDSTFSGHINGKWQPFLLNDSAFVRRDGTLPLIQNWNVEKGLKNVEFISVRNDINADGFLTAQKGVKTDILQLKDQYSAEFITIKINSASQHNEIPSSKAVVDFVSGQIGQNNATITPQIFATIAQTYLRQDGTTPLTGNWNVGNRSLNNVGDIQSNGIIRSPKIEVNNLYLGGNMINTINTAISANPNHEQIPTSRAVFDFFVSANGHFTSINGDFIKKDGSTPLTNTWNVGNQGLNHVSFLSAGFVTANFMTANFMSVNALQIGNSLSVSMITALITANSQNTELATTKGVFDFVSANNGLAWKLNGNNLIGTEFLGSTNAKNLTLKAQNAQMVFTTTGALSMGNSGNIFIGEGAGMNTDLTNSNVQGMPNTFIGYEAGKLNTTGSENYFSGYQAGMRNTNGSSNHFSGYQAGSNNTTGQLNVFLGYQAGNSNTQGLRNVFLGYHSGYLNTTGMDNTFVGGASGNRNTNGHSNSFLGFFAGVHNTTGWGNVFLGKGAGDENTEGNLNVYVGTASGISNTIGSHNAFIGAYVGRNFHNISNSVIIGNQAGSGLAYISAIATGNVFIGNYAGYNETGSNKLYISNTATSTPLIYGDFTTAFISINGDLAVRNNLKFANGFYSVNMITAEISANSTHSQLATAKGIFDFVSATFSTVGNILQNGNAFGTAVVIGTNDNQSLIFEAFNTAHIRLTQKGALEMGLSTNGNIFIGEGAGINIDFITVSSRWFPNVFVGKNAGLKNTTGSNNTFLGSSSGSNNISGSNNTFLGSDAGVTNVTGSQNTFVGNVAGQSNTSGYQNTIMGSFAGGQHTIGYYNTFIGNNAGASHQSGYMNTFIGMGAGGGNITGHNNVFLGYGAGSTDTGSDKLHIANNPHISLIEGSFVTANAFISINGDLGVRNNLKVSSLSTGFVSVTGGVLVDSDRRYKTDIQLLENPLEKINQLNGYTYTYNKAVFPDKNFPEALQIGVIAQEIEAVFPALVATDANGYKSVDYAKLTPVLIEGIKALHKQNEAQNQEIQVLKTELQDLELQIQKINELLKK